MPKKEKRPLIIEDVEVLEKDLDLDLDTEDEDKDLDIDMDSVALVPLSPDADIDEEADDQGKALVSTTGLGVSSAGADPLTTYMRQISRFKLLSPEQEAALTKALMETGDIEVAKKLVEANLRLVVKIAMEYRHAYHNLMDLIQEGNIGLMKAVSKYDPDQGAKLSYYASWWIRSYILKFILDNFRLVKIGTTSDQKKLFYNLLKEKNRLASMGIKPETKTISENLGVSEKAVVLMDGRMSSSELSLDKPQFDENGSQTSLMDLLSDEREGPDAELDNAQQLETLKRHLGDFVATLKDREKIIFEKRLLSEVPDSLQSIADEYGVSRERIRQVEERIIQKLKVYMSEFFY